MRVRSKALKHNLATWSHTFLRSKSTVQLEDIQFSIRHIMLRKNSAIDTQGMFAIALEKIVLANRSFHLNTKHIRFI
jgi:hypothetical protein